MIKHIEEQDQLSEKQTQDCEPEPKTDADSGKPADGAQAENQQPEEDLDELQTRVRGYSEKKWNAIQYVIGAALGFLCGALITYFSTFDSIGMYSTIGALIIALFVPRLSEKRVKRSVRKGRIAMIIALAVWIVANTLIMIIKGVPFIE
mgnify:CR=1 FL=1